MICYIIETAPSPEGESNCWSEFSDIGLHFNGKLLTFAEYINTEEILISSVIEIVKSLNIEKICAEMGFHSENLGSDGNVEFGYRSYKEEISVDDLRTVFTSSVRNHIEVLFYVDDVVALQFLGRMNARFCLEGPIDDHLVDRISGRGFSIVVDDHGKELMDNAFNRND